jgi:hypothetical protein
MTINVNDSIHIPSLSSNINVGNGGEGYFSGDLINKNVSYIDQSNTAGSTNSISVDPAHVHASIEANTHAWQSNSATVDQQANAMAGIGGAGGSGNVVMDSGNVTVDPTNHVHLDF